MGILCNYNEVQSWIEFLSATIYFVIATYLIFLLFLKWHIPEKEKEYLQALSLGFLAISIVFVIRQITHHSDPSVSFYKSDLSSAMLMMLLGLPAQHYCATHIGFYDPSMKAHIFILSTLIVINIFTPFVSDESYLYIFLSLLLFNNFFLVYKFFLRVKSLAKEDRTSLILIKNDIFIFISVSFFSVVMALLFVLGFSHLYIKLILSISFVINALLFVKTAMPFSVKKLIDPIPAIDSTDSLQDDRHKINRQFADSVRIDELYDRLLAYFERDKPYLKSDLKIKEVSLYLYTNKTYLSRVINDKNNQNFNQFVNYYRIEEVKRLFRENSNLNIQELCTLSGFGSMATFSIAFRFHLGYTPADWCKEQKLKVHNDQVRA